MCNLLDSPLSSPLSSQASPLSPLQNRTLQTIATKPLTATKNQLPRLCPKSTCQAPRTPPNLQNPYKHWRILFKIFVLVTMSNSLSLKQGGKRDLRKSRRGALKKAGRQAFRAGGPAAIPAWGVAPRQVTAASQGPETRSIQNNHTKRRPSPDLCRPKSRPNPCTFRL
jgi:hypothetical protein